MRRKPLTMFLSVILAGILSLALFGCSSLTDNNAGAQDNPGAGIAEYVEPAYEPYTHEILLYREAVSDGSFTGTFVEFLQALGTTVSDDTAAVNYAMTSIVAIVCDTAIGSGVIYSLDTTTGNAIVLTNYHVVYNTSIKGISRSIKLYLYGSYETNRSMNAAFAGGDINLDIAVLKVTGSDYLKSTDDNPVYAHAAVLGDSESIAVGERVYALGNPNGEGFSVTAGVVSVVLEDIDILRADETKIISLPEIRTDAAVNHGNSGGGLFNAKGELVGIVNARYEDEGFIGYALPLHEILPTIMNFVKTA